MIPAKKSKVDRAALASAFMRIPGMRIEAARDLLDLGFSQVYELSGRSPEVLFEDLCRLRPDTGRDRLACLRLAVYYAENPQPEQHLLRPSAWM